MLMVLMASSLLHYVLALGAGAVHNCTNTKTEPAGSSGTAYIEAGCHLTFTGITGQVNVQGIHGSPCGGDVQLSIGGADFCVNTTSVSTIIDVKGNELVIKAETGENIVIKYYHGKSDIKC